MPLSKKTKVVRTAVCVITMVSLEGRTVEAIKFGYPELYDSYSGVVNFVVKIAMIILFAIFLIVIYNVIRVILITILGQINTNQYVNSMYL